VDDDDWTLMVIVMIVFVLIGEKKSVF